MSDQNSNVEYLFSDIEAFNTTNAALAEMAEQFAVVPESESTKDEGYKKLKEGCKFLQKTRKAIETARKAKTEEWRDMTKKVNDEGARITEAIVALEGPWKEAKAAIDEKEKREKEERIARLQLKIDELFNFIDQAKDQDSETISAIIEAVDAIDTSEDFYDLTKEAGEARQKILTKLGEMLTARIQFEDSEKRRIAAEEEARKAKIKAELEQRINNLRMIPTEFFGKSSEDIKAKLDALEGYEVTEDVFPERVEEVKGVLEMVVTQLKTMHEQQQSVEAAQKVIDDQKEADRLEQEAAEQEADLQLDQELTEQAPEESEPATEEPLTISDWENDKESIANYFDTLDAIPLPQVSSEEGQECVDIIKAEISNLTATIEKLVKA